ncbi:MAG: TM1812 family CRISPR-associated protein [Polyangia bacterium]
MPTRLVSFLGLGPKAEPPHYSPTRYELDGRSSTETPLMERALCDLLDVGSIVVLGTSAVNTRWFDSGLFAQLMSEGEKGRPAPEALFKLLEPGKSKQELWSIFECLTEALTAAMIEEAGEREPPTEIVLDVTHGFRIQPLFGMAALDFVLSEWARDRENVPRPPSIRVVYGAWEARNQQENLAPIWDLTEFVTASRWNAAIDALMRYGRADDFEQLAMVDSKQRVERAQQRGVSGKELGAEGFAKHIGKAARAFADDLATVRLRDTLTKSSVKLHQVLSDPAAERFAEQLPQIKPALERLRAWVEPLCSERTLDRSGLRATAHLASLLGRLQQFAAQAAVVREGLVTHFDLESGNDPLPEPGGGFPENQRAEADTRWGDAGTSYKGGNRHFPPKLLENAELSQLAFNARNDIEHGGLRSNPSDAASLREQLGKMKDAFERLVLSDD